MDWDTIMEMFSKVQAGSGKVLTGPGSNPGLGLQRFNLSTDPRLTPNDKTGIVPLEGMR